MRITIIKAGRVDEYGRPLNVGSTVTVPDALGASLVYGLYATDTDGVLAQPIPDIGTFTTAQKAAVVASGAATAGTVIAQSVTWAAKAAATAFIGPAFITDVAGGSYWVSNGTRWKPLDGVLTLYEPSSVFTTAANTAEQIMVAVPIPAGLWQDGDVITIEMMLSKSAGVDSSTGQFRLGTAAGTLGTTTNDFEFQPAATTRRVTWMKSFKRLSATTIGITNLDGNSSGLGSDTGVYAAQTVPNMDSQTTYLQYTSTMTAGTETVALQKFIARLTTPTV